MTKGQCRERIDFEEGKTQNTFLIYLASYKKYKYWFGVFYFLSILLFLTLYNAEIGDKIAKRHSMIEFIKNYNRLKLFISLDDTLSHASVVSSLTEKFEFKPIKVGSWEGMKKTARRYKEQNIWSDSLNLLTDFGFSNSLSSYKAEINTDTVFVENTIAAFTELFNENKNSDKTLEDRKKFVDETKPKFVKTINDSLNPDIAKMLPIEKIASYLIKKFELQDDVFKRGKVHEIADTASYIISEVDSFMNENRIDFQNFKVPLTFKKARYYTMPILVVLALYVQFLFLNFRFYEYLLEKSQSYLLKVPAINNIIVNLRVLFLSNRKLSSFFLSFSYILNIVGPILIIYIIGKRIWNLLDNDLYFYVPITIYSFGLVIILGTHYRNLPSLQKLLSRIYSLILRYF